MFAHDVDFVAKQNGLSQVEVNHDAFCTRQYKQGDLCFSQQRCFTGRRLNQSNTRGFAVKCGVVFLFNFLGGRYRSYHQAMADIEERICVDAQTLFTDVAIA